VTRSRLVALWVLSGLLPSTAFANRPPDAEGDPVDGPQYFAKIIPVLQHPRCLNCHGLINPFVKDGGHLGGIYTRVPGMPGADCDLCHVDAPMSLNSFVDKDGKRREMSEWRIPPAKLFFVDRNPTQLCRQIRDLAGDYPGIVAHFGADPRIQLSFVGKRAMSYDPVTAQEMTPEPPDMSYTDFKQAVHNWWKRGAAACGFSGTVTVTSMDDLTLPGSGTVHTHEFLTYHLQKSGKVTFESTFDQVVQLNDGINMIVSGGGQDLNMQWVSRFSANGSGTGSGPAAVDVSLQKDGSYTIDYHSVAYLVLMTGTGYTSVSVNGKTSSNNGSGSEWVSQQSPEGEATGKAQPGALHIEGSQKTVNDSRTTTPPVAGLDMPYEVKTLLVTWSLDLD
jgi:hypothetical protein